MHSATLISAAGCALARLAFGKLKTSTYVVQERFSATRFLIIKENPEFFLLPKCSKTVPQSQGRPGSSKCLLFASVSLKRWPVEKNAK